MELWLPVVGFEGLYEVSDAGRVRSLDRTFVRMKDGKPWGTVFHKGRLMRPIRRDDGYFVVGLQDRWNKPRNKHYRLNRLVLEAFIGPGGDLVAAHNNGMPHDNRLVNLRWATPVENMADQIPHGTRRRGEAIPWSVVTDDLARRVREMHKGGARQCEIRRLTGIKSSTLQAILDGRTWRHV